MRSNNSYKKALHKTVKQYKHFTAQTQYLKTFKLRMFKSKMKINSLKLK